MKQGYSAARYLNLGLSIAFRIMEAHEYCYADASSEFGVSLRSYRRWIARLRKAGMVLETQGRGRQCIHPVGYVKFIAVDSRMFSDASVAA